MRRYKLFQTFDWECSYLLLCEYTDNSVKYIFSPVHNYLLLDIHIVFMGAKWQRESTQTVVNVEDAQVLQMN